MEAIRTMKVFIPVTKTLYAIDRTSYRGPWMQEDTFLSGPLETATTRERLAGYKRALEKHGIEYDPTLSALTEASGMIKRQRWQII